MSATNHYHDRIHRATERLAQLQAKELLANQRQAVKMRETQRREEAKRRTRVAEIVFQAGALNLPDAEIFGVLQKQVERLAHPCSEITSAACGLENI
ncbi:hypothetical protein [Xanthomonas arboricola]|uniref:hypothetical protein n=1 Tax=Xanthomonas arboricola TaxID=56448 RepID=UPI000E0FD68F|nr:hypothetical protein [Xanthomonas arboricola]MBB3760803.1 hypothetical protein [Xanthomonas arboricola]